MMRTINDNALGFVRQSCGSPLPRRWILTLLALLGGSAAIYSCPAYGTPFGPPPHDPTVELTDFSHTPASPVHLGDTLRFTATLNRPTQAGGVQVFIGDPQVQYAGLNDFGADGDAHAGDGIYSGALEWHVEYGTLSAAPVVARLFWYDSAPGQELAGPPLTVEE